MPNSSYINALVRSLHDESQEHNVVTLRLFALRSYGESFARLRATDRRNGRPIDDGWDTAMAITSTSCTNSFVKRVDSCLDVAYDRIIFLRHDRGDHCTIMSSELTESLLSNDNDDEAIDPVNTQEQPSTPTMSSFFWLTVMVVCLPMFLFGFNTGVLNAPEPYIFVGHSVMEWSFAVSAFCAGGFVGANVSGKAADAYGRRLCLIAILFSNLVFGILHSIAPSMLWLIIARFGVGVAGGASTVLTPMMLSEISPTKIRGSVGTLTQLACVLGILVSILWALPFCSDDEWRYIFLPIAVIAAFGLLASPFCLPESPRWLLLNQYETRGEEARNTMQLFRKESAHEMEEIEMEVLELLGENYNVADTNSEIPMFRHMASNSIPPLSIDEEQEAEQVVDILPDHSFKAYAKDPRNRVAILSSVLFPVAQQLSGINAVFYYSTSFFEGVISNPQNGTIIAFSVNVVATLVALALMDRLGRKTLLSCSAGGMFVCCVVLTFSLLGMLPGYITVVAVMLFISFFEMGLGCIPFFLSSELIAPEHVGTVQSISMSSNWFSNFCVGLLFPLMDQTLGPYSFVPFACALLVTVLYSLFVLPETRGKTYQEVRQEMDVRWQQNASFSPVPQETGQLALGQQQSVEPETTIV
ncbi:unnamed protein product [Cylindrotheca closterium]|uniref:Hexose transporter 1 n=1 Tax=Cylindrotheca closterium TaxID=2856 RepID=A0AAD2G0A7_9STRA|nr:unnamed protein product [Cylindrotheca closterium]